MRLFRIKDQGTFEEYLKTPFDVQYAETTLEQWLEANPDGIVEDGELLVIGRQVTTNLGKFIDILGIDREGNSVVVELKRGRTPRDVVAQALEYASFVEMLSARQLENLLQVYLGDESVVLADYHRRHFDLEPEEAVSFNKIQRIVIVGQEVSEEVRQTSIFLGKKGIPVTCVEFSLFEASDGKRVISEETVVDPALSSGSAISTTSLPKTDREQFLKSLDAHGKPVFEAVLDNATQRSLRINWGTRGFSVNGLREGMPVAILFGYPPESVYKQSIYTGLRSPNGGACKKIEADSDLEGQLLADTRSKSFFIEAGMEFKSRIDRAWSEAEIQELIEWINAMADTVENFTPRPASDE